MTDSPLLPARRARPVAARPVARPVLTTPDQAVEVGMEMPRLLMALLERRYLGGDVDPAVWRARVPVEDDVRPLLREVVAIGRERPGEDWAQITPQVLTATHSLGQAAVVVVHGDGQRHHLHLGGRRLAGRAQGSTQDYLDGQGSVVQAHFPGLRLGAAAALDGPEHAELAEFLRSAPALAVVTGVPSTRSGAPSAAFQNIDRLVGAAGTRRYALVVVAEPLQAVDLDLTIDRCRQLKSEIHALVHKTITRTFGDTETETHTVPDDDETPRWAELALPVGLLGLAAFCTLAAPMLSAAAAPALAAAAAPTLAAAATPTLAATVAPMVTGLGQAALMGAGLARGPLADPPSTTSRGRSRNRAESATAQLLDANAEACEALLQRHIDRLETARSSGWWRTSVFVAAESDGALAAVTGALRGVASGTTATLDPIRVLRPAPHLVRAAALHGEAITLTPAAADAGGVATHPLGATYDALATCMTSDELAVLVTPPRQEVPGLPRREAADFALSVPPTGHGDVRLGALVDGVGRELAPVGLTAAALNRHAFITGMTGYGKTTTAKRLLLEVHTELELPFLVIEPVKAEYRALAERPELRDRLRVFSVGEERGTSPLRLNPFVPLDGVPLLRHIDLLKAVFNASFPMFAGMSYVLEEAMLAVYTERGWDLHTSQNDLAPSRDERSALVPSVADLHDKVEQVLSEKNYGREVHQNLGAALRSRLRSLMVGTKGMTLDARRSIPPDELFSQPCVIELRNLGDDEEKAFVMALLLGQLYEYAEARQSEHDGGLQHVTLIEEAHRLLRASRGPGGPESPDAQAKAVTMFTDMLAEMRAYGEGFLVADQIPTKLAPEILKNSNIKILHRLVAPDDRAVAGASVNLTEAQNRYLATLQPGMAVVHDDRMAAPVLVRLDPLPPAPAAPAGTPRLPDLSYLHLHGGCRHCAAPCTLLAPTRRAGSDADLDTTLEPLFRAVLHGDRDGAWQRWAAWRAEWLTRSAARLPTVAADHALYCVTTRAAHRFLDRCLRLRGGGLLDAAALLALERCARGAAGLVAAWSAAEAGTAAVFDDVHARWHDALAAHPPRELPGCAQCPARCSMLAAVAALPAPVLQAVADRAAGRTPPATRARTIAALPDPSFAAALAAADVGERHAFLYCAVTTATAARVTPTDLLEVLRAPDG